MKYSGVFCFLLLLACGCNRNEVMAKLLNEQKILKDSANNINDRIGDYAQKGGYDSAEAEKRHLAAIHVQLTAIQFSIDSLDKRNNK